MGYGCQFYPSSGSFEDDYSKLIFQLFDLPAEGWLTDKAALCRLTEVTGLRDCDGVFQVTQVHVLISSLILP